jgi:hypothetical protein
MLHLILWVSPGGAVGAVVNAFMSNNGRIDFQGASQSRFERHQVCRLLKGGPTRGDIGSASEHWDAIWLRAAGDSLDLPVNAVHTRKETSLHVRSAIMPNLSEVAPYDFRP